MTGYATRLTPQDCFFLSQLRPLPSSFRVNWRELNVDGFHMSLRFNYEPVKYKWTVGVRPTTTKRIKTL